MSSARVVIKISLVLIAPLVVAFTTYMTLNHLLFTPVMPGNQSKVLIEIESGKSFRDVARLLESKGVVRRWWCIDVVARLRRDDKGIKAGEYEVSSGMTPTEILKKLVSGEVFKRTVVIKEGVSIWNIGALVEEAGLIKKTEFDSALTDPELLSIAGISAKSFEGYLFPNTYNFSRPITARDVIWAMLTLGEKHWTDEFSKKSDTLLMSRHEILTLASIIEKESGNFEEQPLISSVFHNRLREGMRLQADPTVIYGIEDFDGNLTKKHLQDEENRYNTYVHYGLPPAPIGNPGENAIKSALFPTPSEYLFFVADGKGSHVFSTTLQEHNEAVNKYQRNRSAALEEQTAVTEKLKLDEAATE